MNSRSLWLSSLIAGAAMALLSNLPVINLANCLLCLWIWGSGILAVFLYRRFNASDPGLSVGQAAGLGALTGVIGAVLSSIVGTIFHGGIAATLQALQSIPGLSQQTQNLPLGLLRTGGFSLFGLFTDLVLYVFFGVIGGIIAAAAIWKSPAK